MLRSGDPRRAVELLEQGRSITWNQVVQTRTDLTVARAAAPELVARLDELRAALDAPAPVTGPGTPTVVDRERIIQAQRRLAEEWDEIVDRIRGIDGLETFLAAVPYEQLAAEAAQGPIVVINLSRYGCCAIALTKNDPLVIDLPELTRAATAERADALLQTRLTAESEHTLANVRAAQRVLLDTLAWLYDTVVAPVLAALAPVLDGAIGDAMQPLIWWCPTGPLTMLPLHAAGHYAADRADTLLDRVRVVVSADDRWAAPRPHGRPRGACPRLGGGPAGRQARPGPVAVRRAGGAPGPAAPARRQGPIRSGGDGRCGARRTRRPCLGAPELPRRPAPHGARQQRAVPARPAADRGRDNRVPVSGRAVGVPVGVRDFHRRGAGPRRGDAPVGPRSRSPASGTLSRRSGQSSTSGLSRSLMRSTPRSRRRARQTPPKRPEPCTTRSRLRARHGHPHAPLLWAPYIHSGPWSGACDHAHVEESCLQRQRPELTAPQHSCQAPAWR